nr:hypothetical protein [uncultured Enterobacter sp.]
MAKLSNSNINAVADLKPGYTLGAADVALLQEMARRLLAAEALEMMPDKDLTDDVLDEIIAGAKTSLEQYLALSLKAERAAMPGKSEPVSQPYKLPDDTKRMDWLVSKTVNVREPMVYGSHSLFWSQAITDENDEYHATKLREQIDAAMAEEQAAAPQEPTK